MPESTPTPTVEDRLAQIRERAWQADREDREPGPLVCRSQEDIPALLAAVEAALSTGLFLNAENAAGADETKRTAMCEGAALHMTQVREAVTEALTGRTEGGNSGR